MLRRVRIRTLDLYEALGTDRLITAASFVEVWRIVHEADGTLCSIFVQDSLERRAIDSWISWQTDLLRGNRSGRSIVVLVRSA
jgi:hypothetical protein